MTQPYAAEFPVHVYWEDTDAGGIVYHANYLKFMERARSTLLQKLSISQNKQLRSDDGVMFVVAGCELTFKKGAKLDDELVVRTRVLSLGRVSMMFEQDIYRGEELITKGKVRVGVVSCRTMAPTPLPKPIYDLLKTYE